MLCLARGDDKSTHLFSLKLHNLKINMGKMMACLHSEWLQVSQHTHISFHNLHFPTPQYGMGQNVHKFPLEHEAGG